MAAISARTHLFIYTSLYEDKVNEVLNEQKEGVEKKFITSPADIEVHRKVELQDAEISDNQ